MSIDHKIHVRSLAGDVHGLAKALDRIVDDKDMPGMQALLNCLLERATALEDALDGPELWAEAAAFLTGRGSRSNSC